MELVLSPKLGARSEEKASLPCCKFLAFTVIITVSAPEGPSPTSGVVRLRSSRKSGLPNPGNILLSLVAVAMKMVCLWLQ